MSGTVPNILSINSLSPNKNSPRETLLIFQFREETTKINRYLTNWLKPQVVNSEPDIWRKTVWLQIHALNHDDIK